MCELFGASSREQVELNPYLREFYTHDEHNPHGWGITWNDNGRLFAKKEPVRASASAYLKDLLDRPIRSRLLLAHVRLATKGSIEYENTHPFIREDRGGRVWTLIHNGTIFESEELAGYIHTQLGNTDSERILCCLISRMNKAIREKGEALTDTECIDVVERLIADIAPENKVNIILTDGHLLYAHANYKKGLHLMKTASSAVIATNPLCAGPWEEFPLNTLLVFRDGEEIYRGTPHEYEFFDSEEKLRFLYLDFAGI